VTTVFVSGAVASKQGQGGSIWVRMSWAEALRRLGFDVVFVEQLDRPASAANFAAVMEEFGFQDSATLIAPDGEPLLGLSRAELLGRAEDAELLVNISGHLRWPQLLRCFRRRAFVDLDPGFTQVWHAQGHDIGLAGHDLYFTVGENVGTRRCALPTGEVLWRPIRQPVVLERWPVGEPHTFSRFTTVANWRGPYGPLSWAGRTYGVKLHQFRRFLALPGAAGLPFELALRIDSADRADGARLDDEGWRIVDPDRVADASGFHSFVQGSSAEFSVAQGVYVDTCSGWFSDRSVRYLASGRPALVQDTGFSEHLPVGDGLVAFRTLEDAVRGARQIVDDYPSHRAAARRVAEEHFAPERALAPLLDAAEIAP
jgi:hypothetical protein